MIGSYCPSLCPWSVPLCTGLSQQLRRAWQVRCRWCCSAFPWAPLRGAAVRTGHGEVTAEQSKPERLGRTGRFPTSPSSQALHASIATLTAHSWVAAGLGHARSRLASSHPHWLCWKTSGANVRQQTELASIYSFPVSLPSPAHLAGSQQCHGSGHNQPLPP